MLQVELSDTGCVVRPYIDHGAFKGASAVVLLVVGTLRAVVNPFGGQWADSYVAMSRAGEE